MERYGVDALLLGPTVNLTYFTGVRWGVSERLFACVVFRSGQNHFIAPRFEEARARESAGDAAELHTWEEDRDPHELVVDLLTRRGARTVAVDSHLRATHALRLTHVRSAIAFEDGLPLTASVRSVKSDPEVARIRSACERTKRAIETVRKGLTPGATEAETARAVEEEQRRLGLTNVWALVLFGANAAHPHGTKHGRRLAEGDLALFDCGGELEGYQSDVSRTFAAGTPSEEAKRVYAVVRRAQDAALAAVKPGVSCQEIDRAARAVIARAGFGSGYATFTHRLGHGIGLEGHEDPYFCEGNETILEPGMTLSNEPGIYLPGRLGVRVEDILHVTDRGAEILGSQPPDSL